MTGDLAGAVRQNAGAAGVLMGVTEAGGLVAEYVAGHDPAAIDAAGARLQDSAAALGALAPSADNDRLAGLLRGFSDAAKALRAADEGIDGAAAALGSASAALVDSARKAEADSQAGAQEAERASAQIAVEQSTVNRLAIRLGSLTGTVARFDRRPGADDTVDGGRLAALAAAMAPDVDALTAYAGWPEMQKPVAAIGAARDRIVAAAATGLAPADVDAALDGLVGAALDLGSTFDASVGAAEDKRKELDGARSKARIVSGLVRRFSDGVTGLVAAVQTFRIEPTPANRAAVESAFAGAEKLGKTLKGLGHPELGEGLAAVRGSFDAVVAARAAFADALKAAQGAGAESARTVADLARRAETEADSKGDQSSTAMILGGAGAVLLALGLTMLLSRMLVGPLRAMTDAMRKLAGGNLDASLPRASGIVELDAMVEALGVFRANGRDRAEMARNREGEEAHRLERERQIAERIDAFRAEMSAMLASVKDGAQTMTRTATALSGIAATAGAESGAAGSATSQAAGSVGVVAEAAEELSGSIGAISAQIDGTRSVVVAALGNATESGRRTAELSAAAAAIEDVVRMIRQVAEQTNLLALNATIEAARAGEAGRGFAVVAGEVKSLAAQTAKATDDVSAQIHAIQAATRGVTEATGHLVDFMRTIDENTAAVADAVARQNAATAEIARNVEQAAGGTRAAMAAVERLAASVGETGGAAERVLGAAERINDQSAAFTATVEDFLRDVQTAA